jgi:gliding motility-associated-like protein
LYPEKQFLRNYFSFKSRIMRIFSGTLMVFSKRIVVLLTLVFFATVVAGMQLVISSGKGVVYPKFENRLDWLVMMQNITAATELSVILSEDSVTVNWLRYTDAASSPQMLKAAPSMRFVTNQPALNPDDHTGYVLRLTGTVNGAPYLREYSIWVIDYSLYHPVFNNLIPAAPVKNGCSQLELTLDGTLPGLTYMNRSGQTFDIKRQFSINYETLKWEDGWKTDIIDEEVDVDNQKIVVLQPPFKDTRFKLSGDQFASDLGINQFSIQSSLYSAIRVIGKITTEATTRSEKNEGDRPDQITVLSGSAPLEINFKANPNSPVANYFRWEIFSGSELVISRTDEEHRYTFTNSGTYTVKLSTENAWCSHRDSVVVKVSESAIYAPNVFTPNGDGVNDEFRVAYRSIIEFKATIYNRWGNRIYEWTDPQKGWDGTFNGRPMPEGPYFFIIRALGSDGLEYELKGDINLLRGKK